MMLTDKPERLSTLKSIFLKVFGRVNLIPKPRKGKTQRMRDENLYCGLPYQTDIIKKICVDHWLALWKQEVLCGYWFRIS